MNDKPKKDLEAIITRLDALYPSDTDTIVEKLLSVLAYCITRKLLDPETLETLRKRDWPESIRTLLATEGSL
jgi:hypothetical protein